MRYRLRVAPRAEEQIRDSEQWWLENRPKAPLAFEEDLGKAFDLLSSLPRAGQKVHHSRIGGLRRVLMGRVRYYLYFDVADETETVEILALWHTSRHGQPSL